MNGRPLHQAMVGLELPIRSCCLLLPMESAHDNTVNIHYLDHVIAVAEEQDVEASEDIIAGNGMKLLSKGARIDGHVKERLLEHKLRKPLEECMRVSDGVSSEQMVEAAGALLEQHAMLRELFPAQSLEKLPQLLRLYSRSMSMQSLITVYAKHRTAKLEHAIGVSLLTMGMAAKLTCHEEQQPQVLLMAGLFHDIGELYIAPAFLERGVRLTPEQWRHIAAHPIISHRVVKSIPGMLRGVPEIIVNHHERMDGYGYPNGLRGDSIPLEGQILAVAELLMGLLEAGRTPLWHADVALKLIPGEFSRSLIDLVSSTRRACEAEEAAVAQLPSLEENLSRVQSIGSIVKRLGEAQLQLAPELEGASAMFKSLLQQATQRLNAITRAFSSTGLDAHDPEMLLHRLRTLGDDNVHREFTLVLKEIAWRLKELERELRLRVQMLAPDDTVLLARLIDAVKHPDHSSQDDPTSVG
jgi:response regulator RpfG family c-di-GMP phosphodiesterase